MAEFPFELLIDRVSPDKGCESVLCNCYLRVIPGRREVYDGVWNGSSVVVKVFSRGLGAAGRLRKELEGLRRLEANGISAPRLLFHGKTPDGRFAAVTEKIVDSSTFIDVFLKTGTRAEQVDLLMRLSHELAEQHIKGLLQKDLHLGNFLMDAKKIYTLDPGTMRFLGRAVGRRTSISQLALLARSLPPDDSESLSRLAREYFAARRWSFEKADQAELGKQIRLHTKRTMTRQLRKCVRTSKRKLRIKIGSRRAVFDRAFCRDAQPRDFLEQIDDLMDKGQVLKAGNTCHVSRLTWNGRDIVVKRYNHQGFFHSLRHTIKGSRARHSWLNAHRLGVLHTATAKPVAYIEELKDLLVWKSYLVAEHVEGQPLSSFLQNADVTGEQRSAAIRRTLDLLARLHDNRVTHSDLKHSNIIITDHGPVLIDLDAMQTHKLAWMARRQGRKYVQRFKKSLEDASSRRSL